MYFTHSTECINNNMIRLANISTGSNDRQNQISCFRLDGFSSSFAFNIDYYSHYGDYHLNWLFHIFLFLLLLLLLLWEEEEGGGEGRGERKEGRICFLKVLNCRKKGGEVGVRVGGKEGS